MDKKNSFTYVISSDEKLNTGTQITYDIDFGGFGGLYKNYQCEVLSFNINGFISATPSAIGYFMFLCENLNNDGIFMNKKLSNRDSFISITPLSAVVGAYCRSDGSSGVSFRVNNCQMKRPVRFKFLKPDFTSPVDGTDINVGGETKWILVLKLTPIID
jgi:hypothetical protein